ncbi:hypothetical protein ADEAN_000658600 [Angomonas deanei]|uniref:Uncharacterized protein n=1 Tax=Angomonas deanei TaxID=59799 RepID=A0A7G2CKK1_9TRYP|nr:hypothetical protein ADEAN_000658600 [Angomonas deanei]
MCQTCELTVANPFLICAECNDVRLKLKEGASPQDVNVAYTHDLSHEFVEDTMENISNMFGIQLLQNSDPETRDYVLQNWEELKNSMTIASSLAEQFGQVPLNYDEQDIKDISALNSKTQKKDRK